MQIICLNRGLRVYDSTLVVPVFYGVYTATGCALFYFIVYLRYLHPDMYPTPQVPGFSGKSPLCRHSAYKLIRCRTQIFNDEVDAYKSWTLFLIFASILVLISGVVLLTHKKPEPASAKSANGIPLKPGKGKGKGKSRRKPAAAGEQGEGEGEQDVLWAVGDDSDSESDDEQVEDEDVDHHQHPIENQYRHQSVPDDQGKGKGKDAVRKAEGEEGVGLIHERDGLEEDEEGHHGDPGVMDRYQHQQQAQPSGAGSKTHLSSRSSSGLHIENPFRDEPQEEFGDWEGVRTGPPVVGRR